VYEGQTRTVEIGVLYNQEKDRELAEKVRTHARHAHWQALFA
jgi:predicted N-formylglutamate amidohydrolase